MSGKFLKYVEEINIEIAKNDDRQISYTDDDPSKDLTNFSQKFIVAEDDEKIFSDPLVTVTESSMTVSGNVSSFILPDSLDIDIYAYRWIFTDSNGNDQTTHRGTLKII